MAQECAEVSLASKVLQFAVIDNDGARHRLAGAGIDDGLQGGVGLGSDQLDESKAGGLS